MERFHLKARLVAKDIDDHEGIIHLMTHLSSHFRKKDFCKLKYFLGIEMAQCSRGIFISLGK